MEDISTVAGVGMVGALIAASVIAPLVWRRPTQPGWDQLRRRIMRVTYPLVGLVTLALLLGAVAIPVFLAVAALNLLVGGPENIPFSQYPMFARPSPDNWLIRLEDQDGQAIRPKDRFGITSNAVRKRFATELIELTGRPGAPVNASSTEMQAAGRRFVATLRSLEGGDARPVRVIRVHISAGPEGLEYREQLVADAR
ncbi:MAG: hypothetical protein OEW42_13560 [Acidimicrobiia bacterium]|nr:hypothetical protein [Acidimicrobiia bacterium]MDH5236413.1 hypothetical protein [Acidimicrobiia bacterium]